MSHTIHINLLRDDERVSSNPIRLRVMVPLFSGIVLAAVLGWWMAVAASNAALRKEVAALGTSADDLKGSATNHAALVERSDAARAEIGQLERYRNGRVLFGEALHKLPEVVPATVQLASITIPPPIRIVAKKDVKGAPVRAAASKPRPEDNGKGARADARAPEKLSLNLAGLVDSAATAAALKAAMSGSAFAGLVTDAEIPAGAFKMNANGSGQFLFELSCTCRERSFQ